MTAAHRLSLLAETCALEVPPEERIRVVLVFHTPERQRRRRTPWSGMPAASKPGSLAYLCAGSGDMASARLFVNRRLVAVGGHAVRYWARQNIPTVLAAAEALRADDDRPRTIWDLPFPDHVRENVRLRYAQDLARIYRPEGEA